MVCVATSSRNWQIEEPSRLVSGASTRNVAIVHVRYRHRYRKHEVQTKAIKMVVHREIMPLEMLGEE